jgi:hypothetical protein
MRRIYREDEEAREARSRKERGQRGERSAIRARMTKEQRQKERENEQKQTKEEQPEGHNWIHLVGYNVAGLITDYEIVQCLMKIQDYWYMYESRGVIGICGTGSTVEG